MSRRNWLRLFIMKTLFWHRKCARLRGKFKLVQFYWPQFSFRRIPICGTCYRNTRGVYSHNFWKEEVRGQVERVVAFIVKPSPQREHKNLSFIFTMCLGLGFSTCQLSTFLSLKQQALLVVFMFSHSGGRWGKHNPRVPGSLIGQFRFPHFLQTSKVGVSIYYVFFFNPVYDFYISRLQLWFNLIKCFIRSWPSFVHIFSYRFVEHASSIEKAASVSSHRILWY